MDKGTIALLHDSNLTDEQYLLFETMQDVNEVFGDDEKTMRMSYQILDGSMYDKIFAVKRQSNESITECLDGAYNKHEFWAILLINGENDTILNSSDWAKDNNNYLYAMTV